MEAGIAGSEAFNKYLDWPGIQRVFELKRTVFNKKDARLTREETVYGIIGWGTPPRTDVAFFLECSHGHWGIENRSHYVHDVRFDEDRSQVRVGSTHKVMASLRNVVIGLARLAGAANIAKACRDFPAHPYGSYTAFGTHLKTEWP